MNAAQIHLALNHAPLFLSLIGGSLLILGSITKNNSLKTVSLYMLVVSALCTVPVFLTGEGTEELVENMAGVNETSIEKHEEMAKISLIVIIISGIVALTGILVKKNARLAKVTLVGAMLLSVASFVTMAQTAHLGGLIRHTELQAGAGGAERGNDIQNSEGSEKGDEGKQEKKKDDD